MRAINVTRYGMMLNTWEGTTLRAGIMEEIVAKAREAQKSIEAPNTPRGVQRPNATAAKAMKPLPLVNVSVY